jgi:hypothetical protein
MSGMRIFQHTHLIQGDSKVPVACKNTNIFLMVNLQLQQFKWLKVVVKVTVMTHKLHAPDRHVCMGTIESPCKR